ncbi:glycosyltransferase family protein [Pseudodesulfovibrio sp.]|uniref:glycosyltransferase family protein n=1 Tax=unclassified Pseudodesulfovibrio TaxID=2661612 RepID=UPI003B006441
MSAGLIAWIGGIYFSRRFAQERGFEVEYIPLTEPAVFTWDDIVARCGREPDYVLYTDRSMPPPLLGVERFPCPTAIYAVDSHIHSWLPLYAQGFDLALVSLRDHLPLFRRRLDHDHVVWLPPYPLRDEHPPENPVPRKWDVLFAGNVDAETTPKRYAFLRELGARLPNLEVRAGDFAELFPQARVVLNYAEHGDLNFRVFEALATRSCLVTPRVGHGLDKLFRDGEHLVTYDPDDMDGLVETLCLLLADESRREALADAGYAEVNARHRPEHRAAVLLDALDALGSAEVGRRLGVADSLHAHYLKLVYLHWAEALGDCDLARRYLRAAIS